MAAYFCGGGILSYPSRPRPVEVGTPGEARVRVCCCPSSRSFIRLLIPPLKPTVLFLNLARLCKLYSQQLLTVPEQIRR